MCRKVSCMKVKYNSIECISYVRRQCAISKKKSFHFIFNAKTTITNYLSMHLINIGWLFSVLIIIRFALLVVFFFFFNFISCVHQVVQKAESFSAHLERIGEVKTFVEWFLWNRCWLPWSQFSHIKMVLIFWHFVHFYDECRWTIDPFHNGSHWMRSNIEAIVWH